jgi:hypothetical protein
MPVSYCQPHNLSCWRHMICWIDILPLVSNPSLFINTFSPRNKFCINLILKIG